MKNDLKDIKYIQNEELKTRKTKDDEKKLKRELKKEIIYLIDRFIIELIADNLKIEHIILKKYEVIDKVYLELKNKKLNNQDWNYNNDWNNGNNLKKIETINNNYKYNINNYNNIDKFDLKLLIEEETTKKINKLIKEEKQKQKIINDETINNLKMIFECIKKNYNTTYNQLLNYVLIKENVKNEIIESFGRNEEEKQQMNLLYYKSIEQMKNDLKITIDAEKQQEKKNFKIPLSIKILGYMKLVKKMVK